MIYLIGDVHGRLQWVEKVFRSIRKAQPAGSATCIFLGDFGIWPGAEDYPARLAKMAKKLDIKPYFLDGNHEDFTQLAPLLDGQLYGSNPVEFIPGLWWLPRGSHVMIEGLQFFALGGEVSVDQSHRVLGESWWPEEAITVEQKEYCLNRIASLPEIDVFLTHGGPSQIDLDILLQGQSFFQLDDELEMACFNQRYYIGQVLAALKPDLHVHGHYHRHHITPVDWCGGNRPTTVVGLKNEFQDHSVLRINTGDGCGQPEIQIFNVFQADQA